MKKSFYSNGKLLLSGEYVVLDGAAALAMPTRFGQRMTMESGEDDRLTWRSINSDDNIWFEGEFHFTGGTLTTVKEDKATVALLKILKEAVRMNPGFQGALEGIIVTTKLDFPNNWGLGSSSTLINNIAQWAELDAFKLLDKSFGGSGYDIAAAKHDRPIMYHRGKNGPEIQQIDLVWNFTADLFFVHLNQKQDSKLGIERYRSMSAPQFGSIEAISEITNLLCAVEEISEFTELMEAHEMIISDLIDLPTVKDSLFPDYPGLIKSLGAWGGDFILVSGDLKDQEYFRKKGFNTIVSFKDMLK